MLGFVTWTVCAYRAERTAFMKKTKWLLLLVSILGLGLSAAPARSADEVTQPYVVLVGIDKFDDEQILPRKNAEADAKALYDLFVSKDHLGDDTKHIKLLLGTPDKKRPSETATRANILKAIKWMGSTPTRDDLVVFAFIGQGGPIGDRVCFFAKDSTFKNRAKDAVAAGDLEHALDALKSQRFVAFIDANFLGFKAVGKEPLPDANPSDLFRVFLGKEDAQGNNPSRVAFLANSGTKPSLTLEKSGILTQAVVQGLKGKADVEGYEPDGVITVEELAKYVRKELPDLARKHGKTDEEKSQFPIILEGQNTNFVVDLNPAAHPKAVDRLNSFEKLARQHKLAKEIAEEGHNLLSRMPKLEAQQSLRKVYQKFAEGKLEVTAFQTERKSVLDTMLISERDANNYAIMVMRAAKVVRQGFVKDVNQGQLIDYAVRGLYKHLNEKMPSSIKDRLDTVKSLKEVDLLKLLADARQHLGKREDLANGKDITHSLHPMLNKLDKHTDYIDPETLTRLEQDIRGHFSGIGVQIRKNNLKDQLQVVTPIKGSPAYKAKIWAGDMITTIVREVDSNGKKLDPPEIIPTKGMTTEEAVKKILGKEGTRVKLIVEREGEMKPLEFNLLRGKVEVETVLGHKRTSEDSWNYVIDPENKICYVRLSQFSHNTARDLERVMKELSKVGVKGFILDLRFNPGGLLDSAVKISDLFIDDGLIVTIRPRSGPETSYVGKADGSYLTFPMVCLVNGHSASASEIVSAALQDHGRAIIIGSRSYGKGSVQTIHPFDTGGRLKLTTATFWRPSNRNLNRASTNGRDEDEWGVTPDAGFTLKIPTKELNDLQDHQRDREIIHRPDKRNGNGNGNGSGDPRVEFRDRQLDMALEYLRGQIKSGAKVARKKAG
jgi:C-terminal peptidase prc